MGDGTQKLGWVRGTALGVAVLGVVFLLVSGIPSYVGIRFQNPDATILASRFETHWLARIKKTREIDRVLRAIVDEHPALSSLRPSPTGYLGRASDILLIEDGTLQHVVFVHGWGDCPAGCIHVECFCFVNDTTTGEVVEDRNHALDDLCPWGHCI